MNWTFHSHLDVFSSGKSTLKQVWQRPSSQWEDTFDWTVTEDTPGKENPPQPKAGHWTSIESFKKQFPNFNG